MRDPEAVIPTARPPMKHPDAEGWSTLLEGAPHPETAPAEEPVESLPKDLPRIGTLGVLVLAILFLGMLGGLFLLGYLPHRRLQAGLLAEAASASDTRPVVSVAAPKRQEQAASLLLPADIQSYQQTAIHARANGYMKKLLADIGDRVTAGQLLAQIDTPEVDAQLNEARAAVEQTQANLEKAKIDFALAQTTLERYENFGKSGGVTQQQLDEKRTQFNQAKANLAAANAGLASSQAQVQRLEALQSFEKVTAPFAGVITARNYDVGALLSGSAGSAKPLFQLDQTDPLRVFVKVPQGYATQVRTGQKAELTVRNYPGRSFEGKVTRSAGAMDPATRTLRVEVHVPNPDGLLFAGMYGQVRFEVTQADPPLLVRTSALVFNTDGLSVGVVRDGKAHFQPVTTGRDLGTEIEILSGLTGGEQVITNPGELIREGTEVRMISAPPISMSGLKPAQAEGTRSKRPAGANASRPADKNDGGAPGSAGSSASKP